MNHRYREAEAAQAASFSTILQAEIDTLTSEIESWERYAAESAGLKRFYAVLHAEELGNSRTELTRQVRALRTRFPSHC